MNHQISRRTAGLLAFSAPILPLRPAIGAENSLPGFSGRVYPPFLQKYNQVKVEPKGKEDPGFSFAYPKGWVYMLEVSRENSRNCHTLSMFRNCVYKFVKNTLKTTAPQGVRRAVLYHQPRRAGRNHCGLLGLGRERGSRAQCTGGRGAPSQDRSEWRASLTGGRGG